MRTKYLILGLVMLLLTISYTLAQSTGVTVKLWDNSEQQFNLTNTGKFYFENGMIMIDEGNGYVTPIAVTTIRRITLQAGSGIENFSADASLWVYPNPTSDKLFFASEQVKSVVVAIYGINGQLLMKYQTTTDESIDVSSLSKGIYIIKVDEQTLKFCKL